MILQKDIKQENKKGNNLKHGEKIDNDRKPLSVEKESGNCNYKVIYEEV